MGYVKRLNNEEVQIVNKKGIKIITRINKDTNFNGLIERANNVNMGYNNKTTSIGKRGNGKHN